jgi:endonuclease YncB( thermonuclease family)
VILIFLVLWPSLVGAEDFTGKVFGVADGDTLSVMHQGRAERIRLHGIDALEKGQLFTNRAKQFVSDLCYHKEVKVETKGQDRYQRTIADVILPDGRILNYEIVKAGLAWWFKRYAPNDPTLEGLESQAREAKRGLWVLRDPVPPWEFRRNKPAPYTERE